MVSFAFKSCMLALATVECSSQPRLTDSFDEWRLMAQVNLLYLKCQPAANLHTVDFIIFSYLES